METNWNKYFFNFIDKHSDKLWNWDGLSENPSITWDIVEANPDKPWEWDMLSSNSNITWDIVDANPDKPWDWYALSKHPNITWNIVEANPDKPWCWCLLSINPNITMDISNMFKKDKEIFELRVKHQRFVRKNLFEEFVKVYMHPNRVQQFLDIGYSFDELDDLL